MERHEKRPVWPFAVTYALVALSIVALMFLGLAWPAYAQERQTVCGPTKELREKLAKDFEEVETAVGVLGQQSYLSVYVSPGGETWTILANGTDGRSCVLGSGTHWFQNEVPVAGDPA